MNRRTTALATVTFVILSSSAAFAWQQGSTQQTGSQSSGSTQSTGQSAGAAKSEKSAAKNPDEKFAMQAAIGGMAEVEMGKLALEKAASDDVKKFAQRMVDDHSKANDELKQIASSKGINLPASLDAKHKATMDKLSKLSGAEFDKAYMAEMNKDHAKDLSLFERQSNQGKDAELKAFAAKTLPTLREHAQMAKETHGKVSGAGMSSKSTSGSTATKPMQ